MNELYNIIFLPVIAGIVLFAFPEKTKVIKGIIALIIAGIVFFFSIKLFSVSARIVNLDLFSTFFKEGTLLNNILREANNFMWFNIDNLSKFITLAISFFGLIILVYSLSYISKNRQINNYYPYFLITLGLSAGAVLTDNLLLFITFWGILGLTLYKLIKGYDEESSSAAKKTLILIGASDGIMILGIGIIWKVYGTFTISELSIPTTYPILVVAFLALLTGSFTKAGVFPFHTWIPDYTKNAPASSSAYLPASLDKLLGIYFLTRICIDIFTLNQWLTLLLLLLGIMTIIFAAMMAMIQHNYKRLLGYSAVSQVGYMVLGLGLGTPLGIAGGLFHMINNTLYKSGLFLSAGSIEKRTGKQNLDELGGLSKNMPVTFISAIICALAISGVPPLNGFASKWIIYQGIIDFGKEPGIASQLWIIWLGLAVIGSALTLAYSIKYISGIFLGRKREVAEEVKEVSVLMWLPNVIIAFICIGFGVLATNFVVPKIIMPLTGEFTYIGIWDSTAISILILVSILLGFLIYLVGNIKNFRTEDSFIGGEKFREETSYSVNEFYKGIRDYKLFSFIYNWAERKCFDIYEISKKFTLSFSDLLSKAHTGVLTFYAIWILTGLILMIIILILMP
jgi:formate hydrogenlyase subunit 3/multisubunit Na+/H+ antiporter MnhD subunit